MKKAMVLVVALGASIPTAVQAADPPPATSHGSSEPTAQEQAQMLADRAYQAYERADFPTAIGMYLDSYRLVAASDVLFNIASIYDKKLKASKQALEYYHRYLDAADAQPDLIAKANERIAALEAANASSAHGSASSPATRESPAEQPASSSWSPLRIAGAATAGVGAIGLGVGVVTALIAKSKHSDATDQGCSGSACPNAGAASTERDAASVANISTVSFIAGGVLLAGGVALYLFAPRGGSSSKKAGVLVTPSVDPRGAGGLVVSGRFF
ncbi:soluble NSF attachment family protein [Pendulispora rubella]|uniref:Soluble NSF attachment family protein n=1 Tax=Pendulispora rubella TaxID=2741070 RepID=A0ABZ2L217_9BACT